MKLQLSKSVFITFILYFLLIHSGWASDYIVRYDSTAINKRGLYKAIAIESAYYAGSLAILNNVWYKDKAKVPFHFFNDNRGYLQVDKFGHAFGAYAQSYIGYHWLESIGVGRTNALIFGGTLGFILQTPIEIMDGTHEGWGFSWGDMAANAFGSALVIGNELLFKEQLIKFKFGYWESSYSRNANGYLGKTSLDRLLKDYNGHTYWLSLPVNKLVKHQRIPKWLNIAVGYGANGMYGEFENITEYNGVLIPPTERYRQYLFSFDVDWTKIKTRSKVIKIVFKGLTFIKLPFPALELNSKGQLKGYWIYF
jgi:hypothetical protein